MHDINKQLSLKTKLVIATWSALLSYITLGIYKIIKDKPITAQEYSADMTDYIADGTPKELLKTLDSISFVHFLESKDIPANEGVLYINSKNHLYNELIRESLPYIQDYMKKNNIRSREDILEFSNNFIYQTGEEKEKLYNGNTCVKTPIQTLIEKTGDCDDLSLLYYSMFTILGEEAIIVLEPGHGFLLIPPTALEDKGNTYRIVIKLDKKIGKVVGYEINKSIGSNLHSTERGGDLSIKESENAGIYSIFQTTANSKGIATSNDTTKRESFYSNEGLIK